MIVKLGLAAFFLTYVVRYTYGPFDIFLRIRKAAGIEYFDVYDSNDEQVDIKEVITDSHWAHLFGCFWCLTTWISFIIIIVNYVEERPWHVTFADWFAVAAISGLLNEVVNWLEQQITS